MDRKPPTNVLQVIVPFFQKGSIPAESKCPHEKQNPNHEIAGAGIGVLVGAENVELEVKN